MSDQQTDKSEPYLNPPGLGTRCVVWTTASRAYFLGQMVDSWADPNSRLCKCSQSISVCLQEQDHFNIAQYIDERMQESNT